MNITYFFFSLFGIILYGITFDPSSFLPLENFPNKRRGRRCNGHFIGLVRLLVGLCQTSFLSSACRFSSTSKFPNSPEEERPL